MVTAVVQNCCFLHRMLRRTTLYYQRRRLMEATDPP